MLGRANSAARTKGGCLVVVAWLSLFWTDLSGANLMLGDPTFKGSGKSPFTETITRCTKIDDAKTCHDINSERSARRHSGD